MNTINYRTSTTNFNNYSSQAYFSNGMIEASEENVSSEVYSTPTNRNEGFSFQYVNSENNQQEKSNYSYAVVVDAPYKLSEYAYEGENLLEEEVIELYEQTESNWTVQYEQPTTVQQDPNNNKETDYMYQSRTSISYTWSTAECNNLSVSY